MAQIEKDWQEPWGDRRQELVFIGIRLDEHALRSRLDAALLTDREVSRGESGWAKFRDPFPVWLESEVSDESPSDSIEIPQI